MLENRRPGDIASGLLKGIGQGAVRLPDGLIQILAQTLLLDQYLRAGNTAVNEAGVVQVNLFLKGNEFSRIFHAQHIGEQREPEDWLCPFSQPLPFQSAANFLPPLLLCVGHCICHPIYSSTGRKSLRP